MSYADSRQRLVTAAQFAQWLSEHRRQGEVSLVMKLSDDKRPTDDRIPQPDRSFQHGRMLYYLYLQQP